VAPYLVERLKEIRLRFGARGWCGNERPGANDGRVTNLCAFGKKHQMTPSCTVMASEHGTGVPAFPLGRRYLPDETLMP
jgi:hypothetical protein